MAVPNLDSGQSGGGRAVPFAAIALHALVGIVAYLPSGLLVPGRALALLAIIWIALLAVVIRWRPTSQWRTLLVPLGAGVLWYAVVQGGSWIFGWTA